MTAEPAPAATAHSCPPRVSPDISRGWFDQGDIWSVFEQPYFREEIEILGPDSAFARWAFKQRPQDIAEREAEKKMQELHRRGNIFSSMKDTYTYYTSPSAQPGPQRKQSHVHGAISQLNPC